MQDNMIGKLKWEDVYLLWNNESYNFPKILSDPMTAKTVFVEYDGDGYIYGFDWLQNNTAQARKELIQKNSLGFLYFTQPTNKGTIQTAEMLMTAKTKKNSLPSGLPLLLKNYVIIGMKITLGDMQLCFIWRHVSFYKLDIIYGIMP